MTKITLPSCEGMKPIYIHLNIHHENLETCAYLETVQGDLENTAQGLAKPGLDLGSAGKWADQSESAPQQNREREREARSARQRP